MSNSNVIECPVVVCPVEPCPCPVETKEKKAKGDWGFKPMILPERFLEPGDIISSPSGSYQFKIVGYAHSQLYWDFRGQFCKGKWKEAIASDDEEEAIALREFFGQFKSENFVFAPSEERMTNLLGFLMLWGLVPLDILVIKTQCPTPYKDNNSWEQLPSGQWRQREYPASYETCTVWRSDGVEQVAESTQIRTPRWHKISTYQKVA